MAELEVREAGAVFSSETDLLAAIDDLLESGFDRAQLSVLADDEAVRDRLGERYRDIREAVADPTVARQAPVQPEEAREGMAAATGAGAYAGAVVVAGAIVATGGALIPAAIGAAAG